MIYKNTLAILGLAALTGCATPRGREEYKLTNINIVLDSEENVNKAYRLFTADTVRSVSGFQLGNTIYCRHNDNETLGHEVRHLLEGKFHD